MATPIASSLEDLRLGTNKKPKKDWTLPPAFLSLLPLPLDKTIDQLIPLRPISPPSTVSAADLSTTGAPFIDALKKAPNTLTEKGAHAHKSTDSALVDLFGDFAPGMEEEHLYDLLGKVWKEDPLATIKLIFQCRSIHEGKGWREGFYRALAWVWDNHPRTLLENLHVIVDPTCERPRDLKRDADKKKRREAAAGASDDGILELDDEGSIDIPTEEEEQYPARPHGTFKDLIDLLILHINGQLTTTYKGDLTALDEAFAPSWQGANFKTARLALKADRTSKRDRNGFNEILKAAKKMEKKDGVSHNNFHLRLWRAPSAQAKHSLLHKRAEKALTSDKKYQALFLTVLHLFVKYLRADLKAFDQHRDFLTLSAERRKPYKGESSPFLFEISYAAKWAPTPANSGDRQTLFSTALAMMLYPGDGVQWSRERLQKLVLTPLRKALAVPEVAMSNNNWKIDYTKVPSRSMVRNSESFVKHDPQGFETYLNQVSKGKKTISGASLMPHELLFEATQGKTVIQKRLADLQWKTLVDSIRKTSADRLSNCIAVADVSGSMGSFGHSSKDSPSPILPCIALTLLLGELAIPPWNGAFFTFSAEPRFETIETSLPLSERAATLSHAHWEMSTNFYKVFDLILNTAKQQNLKPDEMVKKVFVFSDMQFDAAAHNDYGETEHKVIERKFAEAGYPLPEIVYWNLAPRYDGAPKQVKSDTPGVSIFSGFSGALMKYFLGRGNLDDDEDMGEPEVEVEEEEEDEFIVLPGGGKTKKEEQVEKTKKKLNPLETVMRVIDAESFSGLKVVD
ncbi:uncharacterized protein I303_106455 [Kwoniella dejecticola CBS 10117]|uniref:TROVE domain-containing protein n=1 Tax=Kwoniella dejecticola CBS 10117 TaxID=1296121 RepID=A0A1A5ZUN5_9TREE|nr:uncharacterized protein I303_08287 [Kwoniella dejecticola CBS 10117]OBR81517.1 hypothetical protein I303_08287 [Kwoniella dejecticola CBS 10117]